jgi:hypothetical protein
MVSFVAFLLLMKGAAALTSCTLIIETHSDYYIISYDGVKAGAKR